MPNLNDPRQSQLFDVSIDILSHVAYRRHTSGWQHLFRCAILQRMPAEKLAEHFYPDFGRPTKELYSMAGLVFMMEFRNWTHNEAADAYMFNIDVQYALNLSPENQSLCRRTIERYLVLFRNDELAGQITHSVTAMLMELGEFDVCKQRLDATYIESNMAKFGRFKLMATTIHRFLHQAKQHDEGSDNALRRSVRGKSAVFMSCLLKVAGWNLLRAASGQTLLAELASKGLTMAAKFAFESQSGNQISIPLPTVQLPGRHSAPTTHFNA